jgi:hypothetical protein
MKRDLTVSGFVLALVSVGVLLSAYTDQPIFWLLVHQVSDWGSGVAIKMGRRQGATKEHI